MIVRLNNVNVTAQVIAPTLKIVKNSNFQNDVTFQLRSNDLTLAAGMEVIITDASGNFVVFGGLIQKPIRKPLILGQYIQTIKSKGYRQILSRRSFSVNVADPTNAGDIVEQSFDNFLAVGSATSEGFTKGTIDEGIEIESKVGFYSAYKLYTDLAIASGLAWWIADDKVFNFTSAPTPRLRQERITDSQSDILNPFTQTFEILNHPEVVQDLSKYRNKQFVIGKADDGTDIIGSAENTNEINRMKLLYGSGVYGNIITNNDIKNQTDADDAARSELDTYGTSPSTFTLVTTDEIEPNDAIIVNLTSQGVTNTLFLVERVETKYDKSASRIIRTAKLKARLPTSKFASSWTDDWGRAFSNEIASVSGGGAPGPRTTIHGFTNTTTQNASSEIVVIMARVLLKQTTRIAFMVDAKIQPQLTTLVTLRALVNDEQQRDHIDYLEAEGGQIRTRNISFVGTLDAYEPGYSFVKITLQSSNGNVQIQPNDLRLSLIVYDGTAENIPDFTPITSDNWDTNFPSPSDFIDNIGVSGKELCVIKDNFMFIADVGTSQDAGIRRCNLDTKEWFDDDIEFIEFNDQKVQSINYMCLIGDDIYMNCSYPFPLESQLIKYNVNTKVFTQLAKPSNDRRWKTMIPKPDASGFFTARDSSSQNFIMEYTISTNAWNELVARPTTHGGVSADNWDLVGYYDGEYYAAIGPNGSPRNGLMKYTVSTNMFSNVIGGASGQYFDGKTSIMIGDKIYRDYDYEVSSESMVRYVTYTVGDTSWDFTNVLAGYKDDESTPGQIGIIGTIGDAVFYNNVIYMLPNRSGNQRVMRYYV